jgi:hypothetical protein
MPQRRVYSAQTNVHPSATSDLFGSHRVMRRIVICVASVLAMLLVAAATSGARIRHPAPLRCAPGHAHLIAADKQAQVYTAPTAFGYLEVYGCAYGHKRPYHLGPVPECGTGAGRCIGVERETLAGSIVAYEESSTGLYTSSWLVIVRDLRNGRVLHKVPTGAPNPPTSQFVGDGFTVAIVVESDGAVAWIVENGIKPSAYQVHAVDKTGSRILASGTDIDSHSLALAGNTLYWTQGGKPFSASLN